MYQASTSHRLVISVVWDKHRGCARPREEIRGQWKLQEQAATVLAQIRQQQVVEKLTDREMCTGQVCILVDDMGIKPSTQMCGVFSIDGHETSESSDSDGRSSYELRDQWLNQVCGVPRRRWAITLLANFKPLLKPCLHVASLLDASYIH